MSESFMSYTSMKKCVDHLANLKCEQDVLGALAIYHPDARLISVGLDIEARGSVAIEQQLRIFFSLFPDYRVELNQVACNDHSLLATGRVRLTPTIPGRTCQAIQQPCAFAFTFKDGKIFEETFFLDFGQVCQKSNISLAEFRNATNGYLSVLLTSDPEPV